MWVVLCVGNPRQEGDMAGWGQRRTFWNWTEMVAAQPGVQSDTTDLCSPGWFPVVTYMSV